MNKNSILLLRRIVSGTTSSSSSRLAAAPSYSTLVAKTLAFPSPPAALMSSKPFPNSSIFNHSRLFFPFLLGRSLCSSADSLNIVPIKSEEQFKTSMSKVQDESLPAIFYFTAVWCGPCRLISPLIGELSKKYPHVTTYKIDIDQEGLQRTLEDLNITSVPQLHFYQNGKKSAEVIGADAERLKHTMEKLYKV